jgi:cob(I)alamin adenosyltransferase
MSISTKKGDHGQTQLPGKIRVPKSDLRVEAYGTIDELISAIGFARALCQNSSIAERMKEIQRELFLVSSAVATPAEKEIPEVKSELVERLTKDVHDLEKREGILSDWSIPGEHPVSAAFDVARALCRRAERRVVQLRESGVEIQSTVLSYLNRLSDLLWITGRAIELDAGVDASLRQNTGPRWSRAW